MSTYQGGFRRAGGFAVVVVLAGLPACAEPEGLMRAEPADITVKFDFDHRPLPDIPLPNDIATRADATSPTGLRVNASVLAATSYERRTRTLLDGLDGWGVYQPITIPFTGPIDVVALRERHDDPDYASADDAIYLVDIDRDSPEFGQIQHLDVGNGNYPIILERSDRYGSNSPREWNLSLMFDETDEDLDGDGVLDPSEDTNRDGKLSPGEDANGNGVLDLAEDSDADGVLDRPNYLPGRAPARDDLVGRADALMNFYERETNTLMVSPLRPLREKTRYAVIVTRRIVDLDGDPVGSPFAYVNHTAQTDDLEPLLEVLPDGLEPSDIAFAFSYTTESITKDWIAVREGLYGEGPQAHIADEFPAEVARLFPLKDIGPGTKFPDRTNPYVLPHEDWKGPLALIVQMFQGGDPNTQQYKSVIESHDYVDFHVQGTYVSPQLFDRFDAELQRLPLDAQSWPADLERTPAKARPEEIPFWLVMPRKEVSVRSQGQQAPVVLLGHGYGGNRAGELLGFAGYLAQFGMASLSTDNVSHGLPLAPSDLDLLGGLLDAAGLGPAAEAIQFNRGGDQDGDGWHDQDLDKDGTIDSGVDFWTAYLFHMRDMVRQSALDYMQLIRIIRTWDGKTMWHFDIDGDGKPEQVDVNGDGKFDLAGDFDGDGIVDIGAQSPIYVLGGSLGGIMATTLGGVEPEVEAIIPIAGGGRLTDIGNRSLQGGVPQAVLVRVMGPLYLATMADDGTTKLHTQVTELNSLADVPITTLPDLQIGDTLVAENLVNGEVGCGYLLPDTTEGDGVAARARLSLPSDVGDRTELRIYRGDALVAGAGECVVQDGLEPLHVVNKMKAPLDGEGNPMKFVGEPIAGGELVALAEGFGLDRNTPSLRRFMSLAQMVVDPTDPGVLSRYLGSEPFEYPNLHQRTGAKFLIVSTVGDMNVPASSGLTVARAAGVVDYLHPDPAWGVPANQVLIDTHTAEAVNKLRRYPYLDVPDNENVRGLLGLDESFGAHVDVANFSNGADIWGDNIPRLDPPLRPFSRTDTWGNDLGSMSGAAFPYAVPQGQHGFALPGEMTDWAIQICKETYGSSASQCAPDVIVGSLYDVGWFMFHVFGKFLRTDDEAPWGENCFDKAACNDIPAVPAARDPSTLP
ncbi:MAG: hypothetical protein IPH07_22215 [Deltaproteobacteria bacterium]|nr:hypothetical protein [Deltaproteobacteria bacterium]MBP7285900.1 hypothetical protein [Nannocystaceae bacterium]